MPDPRDTPGHLSVARAFVVQFDSHTDVARGQLAGRIEHVRLWAGGVVSLPGDPPGIRGAAPADATLSGWR